MRFRSMRFRSNGQSCEAFFRVKTVRFNPERVSQQSLGSTRSGAPQVRDVRSPRTLKGFHKAAIDRSSSCGTPLGNAVKDFESFNPWPRGQVVQTRCGLASRPRVKRLSFSVQESLTALPCRGWKNRHRRATREAAIFADRNTSQRWAENLLSAKNGPQSVLR